MAKGKLASRNLLLNGVLGGAAGTPGLPMANLMVNAAADSARYMTKPMRQTNLADLAANVIEVTFDRPRAIDLIGLMFHTLDLSARMRLTIAGAGGSLADPAYQTAWEPVHQRRSPSMSIRWGEPNWWRGQMQRVDLDIFRRHRFIDLDPRFIASAIRIELDDRLNPQGYYDVGGLWLSSSWSPELNFDRGRRVGLLSRDKQDEGPSGRRFPTRGRPRRTMSATWSGLRDEEAYQLLDDTARLGTVGTVIFAPDLADVAGSAREVFPATFTRPPEPQFIRDGLNTASANLEEIIA